MFLYYFFFLNKEDRGTKFIFIFIIIIAILFGFLIYLYFKVYDKNGKMYSYFLNLIKYDKYNFSYFDITPITSMILSFIRFFYYYLINNKQYIIYIDLFNQLINIVFYSILLVALESGYFEIFIHYLKLKFSKNRDYNNKDIMDIKNEKIVINNNITEEERFNSNKKVSGITEINTQNCQIENIINNNIRNKIIKKNDKNRTIKINRFIKTFSFKCCKKKTIINNLNYEILENVKLGLLGNNSLGKTTFFKTIVNEISYEKGSIYIFGKNNRNRKEFNTIKNDIGYCSQINSEFHLMKVKEIINLFLNLKLSNLEINSLCKIFNLNNYLDTNYINLSYSNKRKLHFAISLINYPQLLLLDNPLNGVDFISRHLIWKNINYLFNEEYKCNMILITNLYKEANLICDHISKFKSYELKEPSKKRLMNKYNFFIKFDRSIDIPREISKEEINEVVNKLRILITGFERGTNIIINNPEFYPCLIILFEFCNENIILINHFELNEIKEDLSFKFDIGFVKRSIIFTNIIKMKKNNRNISEIKIKESYI